MHEGLYLEIHYPNRLVFLFSVRIGLNERTPATRVTVQITPRDTGCDVTIIHDDVWEEYADRTREGWSMMLAKLAALLD